MVATVVVKEINGTPGSKAYTTVDNSSNKARLKTKDEAASDLNYPCRIPTTGDYYSYWKSYCLDLSGTFTRVNNVRWYTDGTISWTCGEDGGIFVAQRSSGDHGCPDASYAQASGTEGTTGDWLFDVTNGHAYFKTGVGATPVLATTYTSGAMMTVDSGNHDAAEKTKHVVLQARIHHDATQGLQAAETLTFAYDEV